MNLSLVLINRHTSVLIIIIFILLWGIFYLMLNLFLLLKLYLNFLFFKLLFQFLIFFYFSLFFFFLLHFLFDEVFYIKGLWYHLLNVSFVLKVLKDFRFFYSLKILWIFILEAFIFSFIHWKQSLALLLSFFLFFLLYSFIYLY